MSGTRLLYHQDPLLLHFTGRVVAHARWGDAPSVVLDQTAFYPEAGGQMADRGVLGGARVLDVQVDDAGCVHHVLEGPLPAPGAQLTGEVDGVRRRRHMAQHTGQHLLSRALVDVAGAPTVSSRLGETGCTLDVDVKELDERTAAEAEALVNAVIDADVPCRTFFPTPEELAALPLRRAPKVEQNVRVIQIGDFDVSPCGGTHCTHSSQVQLLRITAVERYKGKTRLHFDAGPRAREALWREAGALRALARDFSTGWEAVPAGVEKLRRELGEAREALGAARARLAEAAVAELSRGLAQAADRRVVAEVEGGPELLRTLAARLTAVHPEVVAVLAGRGPEGRAVVVARGTGSGFDCGAFVQRLAAATGGRGGGRAEQAEGRVPLAGAWAELVAGVLG